MLSQDARRLAALIRALIVAGRTAGMTQRAVANKINRSHATLSQWANGKRLPTRGDLSALCDALEVDSALRHELFTLHYNASGDPEPPYEDIARYILERTALSAQDVADVLVTLARCIDVTDDMCGTNTDVSDLRAIAEWCNR